MTGRFIVIEAWNTGADDHTAHDDLDSALDHRDELRKERPRGRTGPLFLVYDAEDPERGYLEWDDAEDREPEEAIA